MVKLGLADLMSMPAQSTPSTSKTAAASKRNLPKRITGKALKDDDRFYRIAFLGDTHTGKSHKLLELIEWLALQHNLTPDKIHIEYIDLDGGLAELLDQIEFPEDYLECFTYTLCSNFSEVVEATTLAVDECHKFIDSQDGDVQGTWLFIDNSQYAWDWAQSDFCEAVYQMTMAEKMKKARLSQEQAKKRGPGAHGEGVFNQQADYPAINAWHNGDWMTPLMNTGINVVLLSPWKQEEIYDETGRNVIGYRDRFGQKNNDLKVSYIVKLYFNENKERCGDFIKARGTDKLPTKIKPSTWTNIFKKLDELKAFEAKKRAELTKKKSFPSSMDRKEVEPEIPTELGAEVTPVTEKLSKKGVKTKQKKLRW